jgi:single-strand DNA-binding protein
MANFNKVILLGNLTRDIELRYSQGGLAIAKLGMAINRRVGGQDGGEAKETVCFVDLTAFGKQAEVLNQYVGKGSPLFVEGRLEYSTWDGQDGQKHSKLAVVIENFQFVGAPRGASGGGAGGGEGGGGGPRARAPRPAKEAPTTGDGGNVDYGDIPF